MRLTPYSLRLGLASEERRSVFEKKEKGIQDLIQFVKETVIRPEFINNFLQSVGSSSLRGSCKLADLLARPQVNMSDLADNVPLLWQRIDQIPSRRREVAEAAEIEIKYAGYISRERQLAEKMQRLENIKIKGHFDYASLHEISTEGRQKLMTIDPDTLGQASRIPGVSPSDISVLLILSGR